MFLPHSFSNARMGKPVLYKLWFNQPWVSKREVRVKEGRVRGGLEGGKIYIFYDHCFCISINTPVNHVGGHFSTLPYLASVQSSRPISIHLQHHPSQTRLQNVNYTLNS